MKLVMFRVMILIASQSQLIHASLDHAAMTALLRARKEAVDEHQCPTIPSHFVLHQHLEATKQL
jgi:hypothetical protein